MEILFLIIGIIAGGLIVYFYMLSRKPQNDAADLAGNPVLAELRERLNRGEAALAQERAEKEKLIAQLSASKQSNQSLELKLAENAQEISRIREEFQREFQVMAQAILEKNSEKFSKQNKDQIDQILTPLRDRIKEFEQRVEKTYDEEKGERIRLKKEIEDLVSLNKKLSEDAENLTTALRGDNKAQGNWGELILEKILERSGLKEGGEYKIQHTDENAEGIRIRPDVVIFLPDGKHLIVDSKVSLLAYTNLVSASDDNQKALYLRQHLDSVKSHIKGLGEKNYHTAENLRSPDFIMLFMPMEAAFSAALQADPELFSFAWERRIVIVSPTTLLATLRTVENIWRQEKRSRYADQIAEEAGKLYDKFVGFTTDLLDIGKKMNGARESYEEAMKKLSTGPGNVVRRLENMKGFAAKTGSKTINEKLLERAESGDEEEATAE
jgi:DNA recombination protein RmuC